MDYEEAFVGVRSAVVRAMETENAALCLAPEELGRARWLARYLTSEKDDLDTRYLLGMFHTLRFAAGGDAEDYRTLLVMFLPCFIHGVGEVPAELLPRLADLAFRYGLDVAAAAVAGTDPDLLDHGVAVWARIADALPRRDPDRVPALVNLARLLETRYDDRHDSGDLDVAIRAYREALEIGPGDPERPGMCCSLCRRLHDRFLTRGLPADLEASIDVGRAAVEMTVPGTEDRFRALRYSSRALLTRFGRTRSSADLTEAVRNHDLAVTESERPDPFWTAGLCHLLNERFVLLGEPSDVSAAISAGRAAVAGAAPDDPLKPAAMLNLSIALLHRFALSDERDAIDEAIDLGGRAAASATAEQGRHLATLSGALRQRYERYGDAEDLAAAVEAGREAVAATHPDDPDRVVFLTQLGLALKADHDRTGGFQPLDEAIDMLRAGTESAAGASSDLASAFGMLCMALRVRFLGTGVRADIESAIEAGGSALALLSEDHPTRAAILSSVGLAHFDRFERLAAAEDLDIAVDLLREAVALNPAPPILSNLAIALRERYRRDSVPADLDGAVEAATAAVERCPADHPERRKWLSNLGVLLKTRWKPEHGQADLDAAIDAIAEAAGSVDRDHPDRAGHLLTLATVLTTRSHFSVTSEEEDDAIVAAYAEAVHVRAAPPLIRIQSARAAAERLYPPGLRVTAQILEDVYPRSLSGAPGEVYRPGGHPGHPGIGRAAELLAEAVRVLPEVAPRRFDRAARQQALADLTGLAADAAAVTLAAGGEGAPQRALSLMEGGRALLLGQALDLRTDLTELRLAHPARAERFVALRDGLDRDDGAVDARIRLAGELDALLGEIRRLDGFTTFGLPPGIDELRAVAADGPVVTFCIGKFRCDALILRTEGVESIPLPGVTQGTLSGHVGAYFGALTAVADPAQGFAARRAAQRELLAVLGWLWDAVAGPVLDALGQTTPGRPDPPRVWWVTSGLLGLLPLHAAGHHLDASGRTVMDRVVSSYTPSIRALAGSRRQAAKAALGRDRRALIVAMPSTPGLAGDGRLLHVSREIAAVRSRLPAASALEFSAVTRAEVLARLPETEIVHFACHGVTDPDDPALSRLLLRDHEDEPLTVASLAPLDLDRAHLAYLSACETAYTGLHLLDESIHLASAFQLAGFPHVIGTLWRVDDEAAALVAESFYGSLAQGEPPAVALHHAQLAVRDRHRTLPSLWAAHLHAGA